MLPYHKYDVEHYKYTPSEARATSVPHCSGVSDLTKKTFNWIIFKKPWYFIILHVLLVL